MQWQKEGNYEFREGLRRVRSLSFGIADHSQIANKILMAPVLRDNGEDCQDGNAQEIVVEHGIPIGKSRRLDAFAHGQHLHQVWG